MNDSCRQIVDIKQTRNVCHFIVQS